MPNRKTHLITGSASGGLFYLIDSNTQNKDFHIGYFIVAISGGLLGGILPDYIDTPNNPNHRDFAHSVIFGGGSVLNIKSIFKCIDNFYIYDFLKWFLKCFVVGYLSHLALDLGTPQRLPLI